MEILEIYNKGHTIPKSAGLQIIGIKFDLSGAVDTNWDAELHLMYAYDHIEGESKVEIEEAFITSRDLGNNLQLELGHMHTEFGRINQGMLMIGHFWINQSYTIVFLVQMLCELQVFV